MHRPTRFFHHSQHLLLDLRLCNRLHTHWANAVADLMGIVSIGLSPLPLSSIMLFAVHADGDELLFDNMTDHAFHRANEMPTLAFQ